MHWKVPSPHKKQDILCRLLKRVRRGGDTGKNSHGHHCPGVLPEKLDIHSTEAFFTSCLKLHVINTPNFGNLEIVPP
jgi:hypothetical protein